jgi:hypothetical protein
VPATYAAACALGAATAAIQILPFLDYLPRTHLHGTLPDWTWSHLVPRPRLLAMVALGFPYVFGHPAWGDREFTGALGLPLFNEIAGVYVGVLPLVLAGGAAWTRVRTDATVRFFTIFAAITLAYFYALPPVYQVLKATPLLNGSRLLVVPALSNLCLAYLAGRGLDDWRARLRDDAAFGRRATRSMLIAAMVIAVGVALGQLALTLGRARILALGEARVAHLVDTHARTGPSLGMWRDASFWRGRIPIIYADARLGAATPAIAAVVLVVSAGVVALGRRRRDAVLVVGVLAVSVGDLAALGIGVNVSTDVANVYPATPSIRFLQADRTLFRVSALNQVLTPTAGMPYGIADARGFDAVWPRRYAHLLLADGRLVNSNLGNPFFYPHYRSRALDLANVVYFLADAPLPDGELQRVFAGDILIYRRPHALPRAWLVGEVERAASEADALARVLRREFDPRRRAVVEDDLPSLAGAVGQVGHVQITTYTPGRVVLKTKSPGPALLVLADGYDPGWRVFVDGAERRLHLTNYAFRGVLVPAGEASVDMRYAPQSFRVGAGLSIASALAACGIALVWEAARFRDTATRVR